LYLYDGGNIAVRPAASQAALLFVDPLDFQSKIEKL
jgi:hypothetical protein